MDKKMMNPLNDGDVAAFYRTLLDVFKTSDGCVYRYYGETRSYADMFGQMTRINAHLAPHRNKRVVLFMGKDFHAYGAIFSVLLSGNVWIPMDPELPEKRCVDMIRAAQPDMFITDVDIPKELMNTLAELGVSAASMTDLLASPETAPFDQLPEDGGDLAYIMFTSGSTGVPKGVPVTHVNYINFIYNALELLPFSEGDVFSDYHDFGFDLSIFYLFCAVLCRGSYAPVRNKNERIFPLDHLIQNRVTVWSTVPSTLARFRKLRPDEKPETCVRILFVCGEPFPIETLAYSYRYLDIPHIYNFYGLTETGVENFYHACDLKDLETFAGNGYVPTGTPLAGNKVRLDDETSELLISGIQVFPGYLGGIGRERFEEIGGETWFHTGDMAVRKNGVWFVKGRLDSQVKVSGYRVELMDIEAHVRHVTGENTVVCFIFEHRGGTAVGCALEKKQGQAVEPRQIGRLLAERIPAYMIPKRFLFLDDIPVNKNGKTDRNAIARMCHEDPLC